MPARGADFVVLGLTNGPAFHANPCLADQVRWVQRHHVHAAAYAVVSYPRREEVHRYGARGPYGRGGLARQMANAGHAQAEFNVDTMRRAGLRSPMVWLDVEPFSRTPWSRHVRVNRALLRGVVHGYRAHGLRVGIYSTSYLWHVAAGRARPGLPEWRTVGPSSPRAARRACGRGSFQGGPAVLVQWWTRKRDHDLVCPRQATAAGAGRWFHRY
jgi:hypothetical protein